MPAQATSQEAWPGDELEPERAFDENRGETPTGERVPLDARPRRCADGGHMRLSAFRFLCSIRESSLASPEKSSLASQEKNGLPLAW
jgi:hypothetical protein